MEFPENAVIPKLVKFAPLTQLNCLKTKMCDLGVLLNQNFQRFYEHIFTGCDICDILL